jgi:cytochrome b561
VYWIFFLALFWMPITGFLTSYSGGHPIKLFDLIPTPDFLPRDKARAEFFGSLHFAGQWAIYALIVLHLAAVTLHTVCRRTGILGRMLPATATEAEGAFPREDEGRAM